MSTDFSDDQKRENMLSIILRTYDLFNKLLDNDERLMLIDDCNGGDTFSERVEGLLV